MRPRDLSAGAPCWNDLYTSDVAVAREFYPGLFGWTAGEAAPEFGGYFMFSHHDVPVAGCMPEMPDAGGGPADIWSVYLTAEDAAKTAEAATAVGGQVVSPPQPVGGTGTFAVIVDPGGAAIGAWQPGQFAGVATAGEAGLPSWYELHTRDYDTVLKFYTDVFGWTPVTQVDQPGFRYTTLVHGEDALAGVMDATAFGPDEKLGWHIYFWADDVDTQIARAAELGGAVVRPAEDTPFGRLVTLADPLGAQFKLMGPNVHMTAEGFTGV
jgi:uncharacterized protein